MAEPATHYVCDPTINTVCRKTNCHINGGPCKYTCNLSFAKQPVITARLVLPVERTDAVEMGWIEEAQKDGD